MKTNWMTKNVLKLMPLVVFCATTQPTNLFAQVSPQQTTAPEHKQAGNVGRFGPKQGGFQGKMGNLTEEQRKKIQELRKSAGIEEKSKLLQEQRKALREMLTDRNVAEATVISQGDKVNQLLAEVNTARLKMMLATRGILTDEQLKNFHEGMERLGQNRKENFKHRREEFKKRFTAQGASGDRPGAEPRN